jgi:hypothetical protein
MESGCSSNGVHNPWRLAVAMVNSVMTPAVVIRPILLPMASVNHSAPSGTGGNKVGRDEFLLAATAQNLRKLAKLIPAPNLQPA